MFETGSDEYKAYRCEKKYESCYGEAKPFRSLKPEVQEPILFLAALVEGEIPVFGWSAPLGWILVTSRRVVWKSDSEVTSLGYSEIKNMGWSAGPKAAESRVDPSAVDWFWMDENDEKIGTKGRSPWLFIFDVHGIRHEIYLQTYDVIEIWNRILFLRGLEKSYPSDLGVQ